MNCTQNSPKWRQENSFLLVLALKSYASDWPTVTGCPASNPGNNCANGLLLLIFTSKQNGARFCVDQMTVFFFCLRSTDLLECLRKQVVLTIKRPRPGDRWDSTLAVVSTMLTTFTRLSLLTSLPKEHSTTWRSLSPEIHANQRWPMEDSKPSQSTC